MDNGSAQIILCMLLANERWRYTVTPYLIGLAHTQNDPWKCHHFKCRAILRDLNNHFGLGHKFVGVSRNHRKPAEFNRNKALTVSTVPGDRLAPFGSGTFVGKVMTQFGLRVFWERDTPEIIRLMIMRIKLK